MNRYRVTIFINTVSPGKRICPNGYEDTATSHVYAEGRAQLEAVYKAAELMVDAGIATGYSGHCIRTEVGGVPAWMDCANFEDEFAGEPAPEGGAQ